MFSCTGSVKLGTIRINKIKDLAKTDVKVDIRKIALTIDMGGSKTKAIVQEYPEGEPFVLLLCTVINQANFLGFSSHSYFLYDRQIFLRELA